MKETAIAAYKSLVSLSKLLVNVFDRIEIQYPPLDAQPFDALRESVDFLLSAVTAHSEIKSEKLKSLWWRIAEVAEEADGIIDAHVVDLLHQDERYMGYWERMKRMIYGALLNCFCGGMYRERSTFCEDMERVNQILHKTKSDLLIAIEEGDETTHGESVQALKYPEVSSTAADVWTHASKDDTNVVGLNEKVIEIKDQLTNNSEAHLGIITITGMGGIGKTTLAKTVYRDPLISHHFDVRLWVAVSQEYVVEDVIQRLIDSGEKKIFSGVEARDLSEKLYKGLFGRRYLVVMDDVWSTNVWDDLNRFFPRDGNGSRILMTTRDSIVASSLSPTLNIKTMDFLNIDDSWKLLCEKAFPQGDGPIPELEEVGKNIARGCKGLPLSIVVIGSMLASSEVTTEYWETVAKDVNSFRNLRDDGHCMKVLALSYNNLPIYLRACFLDMSRYRKGAQIYPILLFRNWDTWGSIQPIQQRSMESVAEEYFRTLVGRNLILIHQYYADGEVWRCGLHDLLWDLCKEEYHKNQFIASPIWRSIERIGEEKACVLCGEACGDKEELNSSRLVVITASSSSSSQVRPFVCKACAIEYGHMKRLSLVKVMDIVGEHSSKELVHPTTLQYLHFKIPKRHIKFVSPSFAHLLWRLQTLIIVQSDSTTSIVLPSEIWRMPQLREILVDRGGALLTYPSDTTNMEGDYFIILKNLWRLGKIRNFRCTPEVVRRIPNLRVLTISDGGDSDLWVNYSLCNLSNFHKLELLEVVDMPIFTPENISFPNTLKTLTLRNTRIPWEGIAIIGSLPTLEWLDLQENAFIGTKWTPTEGEFLRLKVLGIESTDLLYWEAEKTHFPNLEKLYLVRIHQELEIPSSIGDIATLDEIELDDCSNYVINSAKQIWEEQREDYGNEMLRVWVVESDGRKYELGEVKNENGAV